MDKKLLDALNNLGDALDQIASALQNRGKSEKSATTDALVGGDFVKQIKEIHVGVQQLQKDTQKILKNQETIISLSKNRSNDKKSEFESAGGDKKKESDIKKGVGTILLIAVAVLAIGIAFKLVGGINFFSVIGLSFAMLILSNAFAKIAALKITLKEAAVTSAAMVFMAMALTASSWIMSAITPIGIKQSLTAILIGVGFSMLSPAIEKIIHAFKGMSWGSVIKASVGLVIVLPAIAMGITLSSWILKKITPISFAQSLTLILIGVGFSMLSPAINKIVHAFKGMSWGQLIKSAIGLVLVLPAIAMGMTLSSWIMAKIQPISMSQGITAILIAAVFAVVSFGIKKLLRAFRGMGMGSLTKAVLFLPLVLPAIALGIVLSSYVLGKTRPVGLQQAWSAIMISLIFTVISFGLKKIINAMDALDDPASIILIPLILPAMAVAIWLSSIALSKVKMMTFGQFIVSLGISILFIVFAFALKIMSPIIGKLKPKDVLLIPLLMTTLSMAVWASSHILKDTADISFMLMLKILVFSVVFAIAVIVLAAVSWVIAKYFGVKNVLKGSVAIVALASVVMVSSNLIAQGDYSKYPGWKWSLMAGLSVAVFGAVAWGLMKLPGASLTNYAKGGLVILGMATVVMAASHILSLGNYSKYPKLPWALGVGASIAAFSIGAALLGPLVFGPQALLFAAGLGAVLGVASAIAGASHILGKGQYGKYPTKRWSEGVGIALGAFMPVYGMLMKNAILKLFGGGGVGPKDFSRAILTVTSGIITAAHEFASPKNKGIWKAAPTKQWAEGVGIALGAFMPVYGMLMKNAILKLFGGGGVGPKDFSSAILTVTSGIITAAHEFASPKNKGVWKKAPTKEWAEGVSLSISAFAPVYSMLMKGGVLKALGIGGVGIKEFSGAIVTITKGIITAAHEFASPKNKGIWKKAPTKEWAQGVGMALGAFAPVYSMLMKGGVLKALGIGGVGIKEFAQSIKTISKGIIIAAKEFAKSGVTYKEGTYPSKAWAQGVGGALNAFSPLFKSLSEDSGWFTSGNEVIANMTNGVIGLSKAIVRAGRIFSKASDINWKAYPDKGWIKSISTTVKGYNNLIISLGGIDISDVKKPLLLVNSMIPLARTVFKNMSVFKSAVMNPNFIKSVKPNVEKYADLIQYVQNMIGPVSKNIPIVNKIIKQMTMTAAIIGKNAAMFSKKIDSNFMKSLSKNIDFFMNLIKRLKKEKGSLSGMVGKGVDDPIISMAKGMLALAKSYDVLSVSITKMGMALNNFNDKKISQLERLSKIKMPQSGGGGGMSGIMGKLGGAIGSMISGGGGSGGSSVSSSASKKNVAFQMPKGKHGDLSMQTDKIIDLLDSLDQKMGLIGVPLEAALVKYITGKAKSKFS
jgi:hypothetical protein